MPSTSRRSVLRQVVGTCSIVSLAGCTAVGTTDADIVIENTGPREEWVEYHVDRGETQSETTTVELDPGERHTATERVGYGDVVVARKDELAIDPEFEMSFCRNPLLRIDIGFGAIGGSWRCE